MDTYNINSSGGADKPQQCYSRRLSAELNSTTTATTTAHHSSGGGGPPPSSTSAMPAAPAAAAVPVGGLQRSRSVRASFRLLGARWKSATPQLQTTTSAVEPTAKQQQRKTTTTPPPPPIDSESSAVRVVCVANKQVAASAAELSVSSVASPYRQRANTVATVLSVIPAPGPLPRHCCSPSRTTADTGHHLPGSRSHRLRPTDDNGDTFTYNLHSARVVDEAPRQQQHQQPPSLGGGGVRQRFERQFLQYRGDTFARAKKKKQLKRSGCGGGAHLGGLRNAKENWPMDAVPAHVPSKAAAILEIPVNAEQFQRTTRAWLLGGGKSVENAETTNQSIAPTSSSAATGGGLSGHFKLLKRSVSLNEEAAKAQGSGKPRTATIRRGSVWANSTLSKQKGEQKVLV